MAKRNTSAKNTGKTRVELRFDTDLYDRVKELADAADISVNQLLQGITRWAMDRSNLGEPKYVHPQEAIETKHVPGCVWFGNADFKTYDDGGYTPPEILFSLDFTERYVVRDDWAAEPGEGRGGFPAKQGGDHGPATCEES